ncbi:hypothetical protein C2G38_2167472 [Gigaspora rosea]|uniref:Uncharacterized protein n=1 Tax=Gigaspora rosea TaxID=44941 RepID=A0A397VQR6_9GLOM|nr:hypothetical protein C2G38_2167472 [Gigaspora rosea]
MWVAGMTASVEPSGGYLNRQPKVAGEASCTLVNVQMSDVPPLLVKYGHGQYKPLDMDIYELCPYCPYYFIEHKTLSSNKMHRL